MTPSSESRAAAKAICDRLMYGYRRGDEDWVTDWIETTVVRRPGLVNQSAPGIGGAGPSGREGEVAFCLTPSTTFATLLAMSTPTQPQPPRYIALLIYTDEQDSLTHLNSLLAQGHKVDHSCPMPSGGGEGQKPHPGACLVILKAPRVTPKAAKPAKRATASVTNTE